MNVEMKVRMPVMPNFLILDDGRKHPRQEGFKEPPKIPVSDLTDEQIEQFITAWGEAFRRHIKSKRDLSVRLRTEWESVQ